eukprot:6986630-Pyramimonas_sp.AAC.1
MAVHKLASRARTNGSSYQLQHNLSVCITDEQDWVLRFVGGRCAVDCALASSDHPCLPLCLLPSIARGSGACAGLAWGGATARANTRPRVR